MVKFNFFMDYEFVGSHFEFDRSTPFITPILLNPYRMKRLFRVGGLVHSGGGVDGSHGLAKWTRSG
jgi:hypothetical protein